MVFYDLVPRYERRSVPNPKTSSDLAALARTCKAFEDPALNLLWKNQNSIENVLTCMPEDVWDRCVPDNGQKVRIRLRRAILPTDWERPLYYSQRVKSFTFNEMSRLSGPADRELFQTLRLSFPQRSLFPNIQKIFWNSKTGDFIPYIPLFLGPGITDLFLGVFHSASQLSLLSTLAAQCPSLKSATISSSRDIPDQSQSISLLVRALHHLETLSVHCLDEAAFAHIARLPTLTSL
ncbi:hypothetical protein B0H10DRAFT_1786705, partial [Mycena sp. CBHHK59/15]